MIGYFKRPPRKHVAGMMIIGGSLSALVALASLFVAWRFVRSAAKTNGQIVQMVKQPGGRGQLSAPVFVFRDMNGAEHKVQSSLSSDPPDHQVGDTVSVLYLPDRPGDARIDNFFSLWGIPIITAVIAAFHVPVGLLVWNWPRIIQRWGRDPAETLQ